MRFHFESLFGISYHFKFDSSSNRFHLHGQTLPVPNVVVAPCYGSIGLTAPVEVDPVPGADGYIWDVQPTTGILVNGMAIPVTTLVPYADLTFTSSSPVWKVCVSAFSTCCTSPWNCFFIYNSVPIAFLPTNYTSLPPRHRLPILEFTTLCLPLLGQHTFIGMSQVISPSAMVCKTSQPDRIQLWFPLTFGGQFLTGWNFVCLHNQYAWDLSSETVCMNIGVTDFSCMKTIILKNLYL
jgi:hypothetical protein